MVDKIKCIIFSEFHPTAGPKITFQVPDDYINKDFFDSIHIYIITKSELQNRLITVNTLGKKIVGCPVFIDNPKYDRNKLIFNLCFVFDSKAQTCYYEPVVKKLASYLTQLELEGNFLSHENSRTTLPQFLKDVLQKLNHDGNCSIPMGKSCTVHLKVASAIEDPPPIQGHDVPILIREKSLLNSAWDLTTQQILPYVDGFNHVARIAAEADVEINLVKACLQNLLHYNVIKIISIFQYSNVYTTTTEIHRLAEDMQLQEECIQFVAKKIRVLPSLRHVFLLYAGLTPGTTVRDLCARYNPHGLKIDERKLIQFGLMKGLIRRLHKYPVKLLSDTASCTKMPSLYRWFNGFHNYDEISCKEGMSYPDLVNKIEGDPNVVICWK
ncbi:hypothetical protein ScPMuIL_007429 [Solemya velum]